MTKLIYTEDIEDYRQNVLVSTEILTHYRCLSCRALSSASGLSADIRVVYCVHCGARVELPEPNKQDEFTERVIKSFAITPIDHFADPELMTK